MSRILHKVVTGCLDCPAYRMVDDDEDGCHAHHDCYFDGYKSFPRMEAWHHTRLPDGFFPEECPLKEQTEGDK